MNNEQDKCYACAFEAEMGTQEVPHPVHEKLHRCVTENRETAWDYNPLAEERERGKQAALATMRRNIDQGLIDAIKARRELKKQLLRIVLVARQHDDKTIEEIALKAVKGEMSDEAFREYLAVLSTEVSASEPPSDEPASGRPTGVVVPEVWRSMVRVNAPILDAAVNVALAYPPSHGNWIILRGVLREAGLIDTSTSPAKDLRNEEPLQEGDTVRHVSLGIATVIGIDYAREYPIALRYREGTGGAKRSDVIFVDRPVKRSEAEALIGLPVLVEGDREKNYRIKAIGLSDGSAAQSEGRTIGVQGSVGVRWVRPDEISVRQELPPADVALISALRGVRDIPVRGGREKEWIEAVKQLASQALDRNSR